MALARTACRLLAVNLLACLALAGAARAAAPEDLLRTATSTVQQTVAQADAIPAHAVAAVPVSAPAAPAGSAVAAAQDLTDRAAAVAGTASGAVERAGAGVGTTVQTLPGSAPVSRVPATVRHALQRPGSATESAPRATAPPVLPGGSSLPRATTVAASSAGTGAFAPASGPAPVARTASGVASAGAADSGSDSRSISVSVRGRNGRADSVPEPRTLAFSPGSVLYAAPVAHTPATGSQLVLRPSHGGAEPPVPVPGQGGGGAQAVPGSGGTGGLAMVLVLVLLSWLASFARRLWPPGDAVRDVRPLLILDRPG